MFLETKFISYKVSGSPIDLEEIGETQPLVENDNQQSIIEPEIIVRMTETTPTVRRSSTLYQGPDRFGFVIPEEEVS